MNEHTCPVCGYGDDLDFRPRDYQICGCCGTEFGYDDRTLSHDQLRAEWIQRGCPWFDQLEPRPVRWSAYDQLQRAKLIPSNAALGTTTRITLGGSAYRAADSSIRVRLRGERELSLAS